MIITQEMYERAKSAGACEEERKKVHAAIGQDVEDAYWAYWYAQHVLKAPWPEAEPVIAKNAYWAYWYARDVLGIDPQ